LIECLPAMAGTWLSPRAVMQMRLGLTARATTDLDFLFLGGASQWLDHLDEALLGGSWSRFDVHRKNQPTEIEVPGLRCKSWRMTFSSLKKVRLSRRCRLRLP
jgi:hypothetical protein